MINSTETRQNIQEGISCKELQLANKYKKNMFTITNFKN